MKIEVKLLKRPYSKHVCIPKRITHGAVGYDLVSPVPCVIWPQKRVIIPLGFAIAIPNGLGMDIRPRSGISKNTNITIHLGTIDNDYRGEICIIAENTGTLSVRINTGDRIAQAVFVFVATPVLEVIDNFKDKTQRNNGGFGSTGI